MANLGDLLKQAGLQATPRQPDGPAAPPADTPVETIDFSTIARLVVRRTRKGRGGKTVTTVEGLPEHGVATLAKRLRKEMGVGSRVEEGTLVLNGDQVERVARWLDRWVRRHGLRRLALLDEVPNLDPTRFEGLLALLERRGLRLALPNGLRAAPLRRDPLRRPARLSAGVRVSPETASPPRACRWRQFRSWTSPGEGWLPSAGAQRRLRSPTRAIA